MFLSLLIHSPAFISFYVCPVDSLLSSLRRLDDFCVQHWSRHTDLWECDTGAIRNDALSPLLLLTFHFFNASESEAAQSVYYCGSFQENIRFQVHGSPVLFNFNYYLLNNNKDLLKWYFCVYSVSLHSIIKLWKACFLTILWPNSSFCFQHKETLKKKKDSCCSTLFI